MAKTIEEYSLAEIMGKMEEAVNENPEPIKGLNAIYQFDITDEDTIFQLQFKDGAAAVKEGPEAPGDCTLIMTLANFHKFLLGKLNGTMAFMTGKLKIKGDISKAIKLEAILRQYNVKDLI